MTSPTDAPIEDNNQQPLEVENEELASSETGAQDENQPESIDLNQKVEELQAKIDENYQIALRAKAETENVKRRSERDVSNARKYALERFVTDLIPVMDSLEQGMNIPSEGTEAEGMREGLELTMKLLVDAMSKHGVERVDPQGHPFNPEHHEAMSMLESQDVEPNHVLQVFQKGYLLHGRTVRPARVIVARGPSKPVDEKA